MIPSLGNLVSGTPVHDRGSVKWMYCTSIHQLSLAVQGSRRSPHPKLRVRIHDRLDVGNKRLVWVLVQAMTSQWLGLMMSSQFGPTHIIKHVLEPSPGGKPDADLVRSKHGDGGVDGTKTEFDPVLHGTTPFVGSLVRHGLCELVNSELSVKAIRKQC